MEIKLDAILPKSATALVCIEFQKEWLDPQGTLQRLLVKDKERFQLAVKNAADILITARSHGWTIVHAGLDLRSDPAYALFQQGQGKLGLRGAIPRAGTWTGDGARFVPPFEPLGNEYIVQGRSGASVLANSTLDPFLRNNGKHTLVFMGFALHVCVESSMRQAHDMGYNALVPTDACGVFEVAQQEYFERHVAHHFGLAVTTQDLLPHLAREA